MAAIHDPFSGPNAAEVPLANAPLVRVISQVRFPIVQAIEQGDGVAVFQDAMRARYPILNEEFVQFIAAGLPVPTQQRIWRFSDAESRWRVSLTRNFVALETMAYVSRTDFIQRLHEALESLVNVFDPKHADRIGVRYIDRVTGPVVEDLATLVRSELQGIAATSVAPRCSHSVTESVFEVDDAQLLARWGILQKGLTYDPAALEPIGETSWVLDLDMSVGKRSALDAGSVTERVRAFAETIYKFFRWAVTDAFLRRFGGRP